MDFGGWRSNNSDGPSGGTLAAGMKMNVALVLDRANDPTALLNMSWAERQKELKTLNDNGTLWSTYGADQTQYNNALTELGKLGINVASGSGYVSSAESRTIWVEVTADNFSTLFGPQAQWMVKGSGSSRELVLDRQPVAADRAHGHWCLQSLVRHRQIPPRAGQSRHRQPERDARTGLAEPR